MLKLRTVIGWIFSLSTITTLMGMMALHPWPILAPYWLACFVLTLCSGFGWLLLNLLQRCGEQESPS